MTGRRRLTTTDSHRSPGSPHVEDVFPNAREVVADQFAAVPGSEITRRSATPGAFSASACEQGQAPTPQMQPVSPYTVVDAALAGLGRKLNVRPGHSRLAGAIFGALMRVIPRKTMIGLGDRAVRAMYDRQ